MAENKIRTNEDRVYYVLYECKLSLWKNGLSEVPHECTSHHRPLIQNHHGSLGYVLRIDGERAAFAKSGLIAPLTCNQHANADEGFTENLKVLWICTVGCGYGYWYGYNASRNWYICAVGQRD